RFIRALELSFEREIFLAAFGNELAADEVAFLGFAWHLRVCRRCGCARGGKYHSPAMHKPDPRAQTGFAYSRESFEELVDTALAHAKKLGATDAGAEASEGCGLSVSVRKGELENVERNRDKSLGVTVYVGQRRGNASTSDFSRAAIEQTVQAAYDIARFTAEDPVAGLPDA